MVTGEWINKVGYTYTMEYCSATKGNKLQTQATARIKLKSITPREWSQAQKTTDFMIPFIWLPWKGIILGPEDRAVVACSQEWEEGG